MTDSYVLVFDVGTTRIKAGIVRIRDFRAVDIATTRSVIEYPREGYAEIDPETLWRQVVSLGAELSGSRYYDEVSGIVFTAHMAGVLPVDRGLNPLRKIIIWLDERGAGLPRELFSGLIRIEGYNPIHLLRFLRIAGGAPSKTGKDPLSKILWIKMFEEDVYGETYKFVDVKGYLILRSTGSIVTSPDEAHLTWLADTRSGLIRWSERLVKRYGLDLDMLPEIRYPVEIAGHLTSGSSHELGLGRGLPVYVGAGDVLSTAVGSGAVGDNATHIYLGTSSWLAAHVSKRLLDIRHYIGSLSAWAPGKYLYIAEQETAGSALDYIAGLIGVEGDYRLLDSLASSLEPGSGRLIFLPWMFGERCPVDDPYLRGGFLNLGFTHRDGHLVRSVMEGVAYNIRWALEYFKMGIPLKGVLRLVGGGAESDVWCQVLADVTRHPVARVADPGLAALRGAAVFASVGLGRYRDVADAGSRIWVEKVFHPGDEAQRIYGEMYRVYRELYGRLRGAYHYLNRDLGK